MLAWIHEHRVALEWGAAASVVLILVTAATAAYVLVRMPADRFSSPDAANRAKEEPWKRIARNIAGYALIAAGLVMLLLPGPGVLVILIGVVFADFPGKARVLRWILFRKGVLSAANWLRGAFKRPPLKRPSGAAPGRARTAQAPTA